MASEQERIYQILDEYNSGVEPIENWGTNDIVEMIRLLDAELQRRHDEHIGTLAVLGGDFDEGTD